jgi:glycosyltransferase involved in cell wall biosynthesis
VILGGPSAPTVSIGLPVHNGERYLSRAIESILGPDFEDFQLVISDHGSTDGTPEIGLEFAARDDRVTFIRHESNRGAAWNFGFVVSATSGSLFKWAAHDDEVCPTWLGRCVAALDGAPDAVLAFTGRVKIDADGNVVRTPRPRPRRFLAVDASPGERFADVLARATACIEAYGVIRRCALDRTRLFMPFPASDRVFLAELALLGRFVEVPEVLFLHREHDDRATRRHPTPVEMAVWQDPARRGRASLPTWRLGWEYARAIRRAPVPWPERTRAFRGLASWAFHRRGLLADNVLDAVRVKARTHATNRSIGDVEVNTT